MPELDLRKIQEYAAEVVPPNFQNQIRMEVDLRGKTVTILECRPPWREDIDPEWTRLGVASDEIRQPELEMDALLV